MARPASEEIRQRILEVAEARVWRYGFKKTTIDEIAVDAGVGKGTVYLHFESKEDIAVAIIARYKQHTLEQAEGIARDTAKMPSLKLKEMLTLPLLTAHRHCLESPMALEMVIAVRPHIQARMRPYIEHEYVLLAEVLEEGNRRGLYSVADTLQAARTLKLMTLGFMPPYSCVSDLTEIEVEIGRIVDLATLGLRRGQ
jgi:AcrR family transcriptional regulator